MRETVRGRQWEGDSERERALHWIGSTEREPEIRDSVPRVQWACAAWASRTFPSHSRESYTLSYFWELEKERADRELRERERQKSQKAPLKLNDYIIRLCCFWNTWKAFLSGMILFSNKLFQKPASGSSGILVLANKLFQAWILEVGRCALLTIPTTTASRTSAGIAISWSCTHSTILSLSLEALSLSLSLAL